MGPLGPEELVAIFILALLLFGPKELPKLGKTIGKAMSEFRRAQAELKTTFDREMKNLERETGIRELAETTFQSSYNYDQSQYDPSHYEGTYDATTWDPSATNTTTHGASAPQGAESAAAPLQIEAAHGSIASGHLEYDYVSAITPSNEAPAPSGPTPAPNSGAPEAAASPAHEPAAKTA